MRMAFGVCVVLRHSSHAGLLLTDTKHSLGLEGYDNVCVVRNVEPTDLVIMEACNNLGVEEEACSCETLNSPNPSERLKAAENIVVHNVGLHCTEVNVEFFRCEQMHRGLRWPWTC